MISHVVEELQRREPIFHRPEFGVTRAELAAMVAEDFWEVGASGKVYSREYVLDELDRRRADPDWHEESFGICDFQCRRLAEHVFLVTYLLTQAQGLRQSRRSTVWRYSDGSWTALYHQGTLLTA